MNPKSRRRQTVGPVPLRMQQDPTSFSASFTKAPRLFPAANSTRSSVFAHGTGPAYSVHGPSDLDTPTTSWVCGNSLPGPPFPVNFCGRSDGMRSGASVLFGPSTIQHYPHTVSDPLLPPSSPICGRYCMPFASPYYYVAVTDFTSLVASEPSTLSFANGICSRIFTQDVVVAHH